MKKKLIYGLGSGRCGTASLAYLMSLQESTHSSHELFPILPWKGDIEALTLKWTAMDHQAHLFDSVFDAGIYYLPYVQSLISGWKDHQYAQDRYDLRFICLKREKGEVVKSFLRKFKNQKNNPLQDHSDPELVKNEWDLSFPKYNDVTLEEAIGFFYDDYYEIAHQYEKHNTEIFRIFNTESLNSEEGVKKILSFAGYENPVIKTNIQKRKH